MKPDKTYRVEHVLKDICRRFEESQLELPHITLELPRYLGDFSFHPVRSEVARRRGILLPEPVIERDVAVPGVRFRSRLIGHPPLEGKQVESRLSTFFVEHASHFLTMDGAGRLLKVLPLRHPVLASELRLLQIPVRVIFEVMRRLLEEQISVRDLETLVSTLVRSWPTEKRPIELTEEVRRAFAGELSERYASAGNLLKTVTLDCQLEMDIQKHTHWSELDTLKVTNPVWALAFCKALDKQLSLCSNQLEHQLLVVQSQKRLLVKKLTERAFPELVVLSWEEIAPNYSVQVMGSVYLSQDAAYRCEED
jgi:type III secretory pathway component EscV